MRRLGIRIANVLLFVVCCYAAAGLFNKVNSEVLAPEEEVPGIAVAAPPPQPVRSASRIRDINRRNLFGSKVQARTAARPEPEPEVVTTVTKLPLKLLGTAAFPSDETASRAAIADRGGNEPQVLGIGETLKSHPSVTVASISAGEVVLDNRGSREILRLDEEAAAGKGKSSRPKRNARTSRRSSRERSSSRNPRGASGTSSRLADNLKKLAETTARGGGFNDFLAQAQVLPKYKNGQMVGIELTEIDAGSFYEQIGLKNGDVITEVNGTKITSPTASQEVIAGLAQVPEIFAVVNGRPFVVPADKLAELMESGVFGQ